MATHSSILAWEFPWARGATVSGVTRSQTRLSCTLGMASSWKVYKSEKSLYFSTDLVMVSIQIVFIKLYGYIFTDTEKTLA